MEENQSLLCGNVPFWDLDLSWNTDLPLFTRCFRRAFFGVAPNVIFWLIFPFYVYNLRRSTLATSKLSFLSVIKILLGGFLTFIALIDLIYWSMDSQVMGLDIIEAIFRVATFSAIIVTIILEMKHGARISSFQFLFLSGIFVLQMVNLYCEIVDLKYHDYDDMFAVVTAAVTTFFIFASWICHFFVDVRPEYRKPSPSGASDDSSKEPTNDSPILEASVPSILTFSWFSSFAWLGYKRSLGFDDLHDLPPFVHSSTVVPKFLANSGLFHQESKPKTAKSSPKKKYVKAEFGEQKNGGVPEVKIVEGGGTESSSSNGGQIVRTIIKTYGSSFGLASILKLVHDTLVFLSPVLLNYIIGYAKSDEELWKGIIYSLGLFLTNTIQSLMLAKYFYQMYLIGFWVRSSLTSTIYRKSLRISPQGKADSTTGEVVNLMSVDVQRLVDMMPYVNMLWSAPLQIAIALTMLWQTLGASVLSGFLLMILLIPINGGIAAKSRQFQVKQMKHKDQRVKQMNEILQGIKIIKLYGWEPSCEKRVGEVRNKEINILKNMAYLSSVSSFVWACAPYVVSLVTFATFILVDENNVLDSQKAFVSLALFNILRFPMSMLPMMIASMVQASVSVKRINKYLNRHELAERKDNLDEESKKEEHAVKVENASFRWDDSDELPTLKDINLSVKKKSLTAIVGTVGTGKSSLMSAILGEMEKVSGDVKLNGTLGYCGQQAWIQNATLKDNVLFHNKYDKKRYEQVLESCAMTADLATLPAGDSTEIGEKGINLSGGQKHRVALARVIYSNVDICLLDDPLSAVDAHVGRHIFDKVIGPQGLLANKTRIIVTNAVNFLSQVDEIIVLKDGGIAERGTYQELLSQKGPFSEFLNQYANEQEENDDETNDTTSTAEASPEKRKGSIGLVNRSKSRSEDLEKDKAAKKEKQYELEKMETGKVGWSVYTYYITNMGLLLFGSCLLAFFTFQVCSTASSIWLSFWSDEENNRAVFLQENRTQSNSTERDYDDQMSNLGIYGLFGLGQTIATVLASLLLYLSTLQGAKTLHSNILSNILKSPLSFFDTTPQGRILNRFGKDVDVLDTTMAMMFRGWITCFLGVFSSFLIIAYTTPLFLLPIAIIMAGYIFVQRVYVSTSRQLKRLESVSKSPIFSHFGETLNGVATIRAFHLQHDFIKNSEKLVDDNQKANYPAIVANRWLAIRLEMVGNTIIFCAALLAVMGKDALSPGLVGLSISYALSVTQTLNWLVRMQSELETNIVAVERLKEYSETPTEANWNLDTDDKYKTSWPVKAGIQFKNVSARYRPGLPLVLKDLSFDIEAQQRVGIVGRTGAGKSSITLTLFRIIELDQGQICIDGIDIASLGLHCLRNKLTIIPQDPVLFSGSLRLNLDPFDQYSDQELHQALKLAHLETFVTNLKEGLQHEITEGGENVSVGQRQLICLARALLRKTKILVLDEATAAVDLETDDLIQMTLREAFKECTVLTIAHRLSTILDYDKVLVMKEGQVAEYAPPKELMADKSTIFYGMCADANLTQSS